MKNYDIKQSLMYCGMDLNKRFYQVKGKILKALYWYKYTKICFVRARLINSEMHKLRQEFEELKTRYISNQ